MKLLTCFILSLFLVRSPEAASFGGSGSDAGNGGGLAEKNLIFAQTHLAKFIELCLNTNLCRTDKRESTLLKLILKSDAEELRTPLQFKNERANAKAFHIDRLVRVARTGDSVGAPIFINTDLLYSKGKEGVLVAMDVPQALSVLVHEYGHHHHEKDHTRLDELGTKLQTLVLNHEVRSEFWNGNAALSVYQFNSVRHDDDKKNITQLDRIVLENEDELFDLTEVVAKAFQCPDASAVKGIRLYNVYGERGTHFEQKSEVVTKPMKAWFIGSCGAGKELSHGDVKLNLNFKKIGTEKFSYLPDQTTVQFIDCKDHAEVCK